MTPTIHTPDLMYRRLVEGVVDYAIYMLTPDGIVANWNAGAERAKGYTAAEIVGRHFSTFYCPDETAAGIPDTNLATARTQGRFEDEGLRLRKDGCAFWAHVVIDAIHDDDGALIGFAKITRDITERHLAEGRLLAAKDLAESYSKQMASLSRFLDSVIANIPASVLVQDCASKKVLLANAQAQRLFHGAPADLTGQDLRTALRPDMADYIEAEVARAAPGEDAPPADSMAVTAAGPRTLRSRTVRGRHPDGVGEYMLVITEDVTDELAAYAQIHHMAEHDNLTGLPNRVGCGRRMEAALQTDRGARGMTAVLCLDLDNFKSVNDGLGHAYGDQLLLEFVQRLRQRLRSQDLLARIGGDEFAVVLPGLHRLDEASALAQSLIDAVAPAFLIGEHSFTVGLSVGIATSNSSSTADELLRFGGMALYEAKRSGGNRHAVFHPELEESARIRRQLEADLRNALQLGQIELHYQPIIDQHGGRVSGYEALMRWRHPVRGMVPPVEFIPLAEETGLIHELGEHAVQMACREAMTWTAGETVSVNLSPIQFSQPGLVEMVAVALAASGLPPGRLELEITESVLLDNSDGNIETLRALKGLGANISLDDFGTGYSSLSYLGSFPFDRIKIDRSFVRDMGESREALAIIRAITGLSNSLLIKTTAEGVETREQFLRLQAEGCSHFQGYFFGRPAPANARLLSRDLPGAHQHPVAATG